jgi:hypothetical protein
MLVLVRHFVLVALVASDCQAAQAKVRAGQVSGTMGLEGRTAPSGPAHPARGSDARAPRRFPD